jgi:hypothetical protein
MKRLMSRHSVSPSAEGPSAGVYLYLFPLVGAVDLVKLNLYPLSPVVKLLDVVGWIER